ncbi:MAG TPA: hypothetical protein VFA63_15035 [Pseudonocardiaceae bacterium]|nr:hypothetical protein [Pseudonocardiaceae bacterium]
MFAGGTDFAQRGVQRGLGGGEIATRESFDRDDLDALDTDIAQVGRSGDVSQLGG